MILSLRKPGGKTWLLLALGSLLAAGSAAVPASAQDPGKSLYLRKCAVCHGQDGEGNTDQGKKTKVVKLHDSIKKYSEQQMDDIAINGKGQDMEAFGKKYPKQLLEEAVKYYRSLAK